MTRKSPEERSKSRKEYYEKNRAIILERGRKYANENKEKRNAHSREYYKKNRERLRAYAKKYGEEHKERLREQWNESNRKYKRTHKEEAQAYQLKYIYGITLDEYKEMFNKQDGCCAVCGKTQKEIKRKFHVDHNHETGKIRKLLCSNCNTALGLMFDNLDILRSAVQYLEQENEGRYNVDTE